MLQVDYLAFDAATDYVKRIGSDLVGVLGFPSTLGELAKDVPTACVAVANLREGRAEAMFEIWSSRTPVRSDVSGDIRLAIAGDVLFGVRSASEAEGGLQAATQRAYREIFALLDARRFPHALRFWNYLGRINEEEHGLERYRQFNVGRGAAFEAAGRIRAGTIPASCALGTDAKGTLTVYFVAARDAGLPIENPRQLSAYRYPPEYGPRSPTFARAVVYPAVGAHTLFVSGTASIVGHRTCHVGDVASQTRETLANLDAVFAEANRVVGAGAFDMREASYKVYVRRPEDAQCVRRAVFSTVGARAEALFLHADICRLDLLVEIEAVAHAGHARNRSGS